MILEYIIVSVLGYLLGSINSSILVSKIIYGADIRTFGSGNAGATNTLRTFGKTAAALVILGDALKGIIAVLIGSLISDDLGMLFGGFFAILGHNWPIYFGFKGGKGILTSLAVIYMINWRVGLILTIICISVIAITRLVSIGSILGCILVPFIFYFINNNRNIPKNDLVVFASVIAIIAIYRHRTNIVKLIKGTEAKLGEK